MSPGEGAQGGLSTLPCFLPLPLVLTAGVEGKKEEEEEISAIKGSQHCSIEILYNPRVQPQSREMWLNKNLFGPPYLLAFGMVCLNICLCLKTKETKTTSKQHGLLSSVQEWVKS